MRSLVPLGVFASAGLLGLTAWLSLGVFLPLHGLRQLGDEINASSFIGTPTPPAGSSGLPLPIPDEPQEAIVQQIGQIAWDKQQAGQTAGIQDILPLLLQLQPDGNFTLGDAVGGVTELPGEP